MSKQAENNKRIAKNTFLLYIRMLLTMLIGLYTSRVVLNELGVEDYGIYNVVGGIISLFSFINGAMGGASQRYITYELGKGDMKQLNKVFSMSIQIHALLSFIIILLAETIGLWFLYNYMNIPIERMNAALWVYQCSILSSVVMIMSLPYNALIISHEKMSAFAYISILEVVLKLLIAYSLIVTKSDKLIVYSVLILVVQIIIRLCYSFYCKKHFIESKYIIITDKLLFKNMLSFGGWSLFGGLASISLGQGLNILINIFFGPAVNAARGIAVQVQSLVNQFITNFQTALNPQIIKSYATKDFNYLHNLIYKSAKYSFFLLLFLSLPILFEAEIILKLWLKEVPDDTVIFLRIIVITTWIHTLSNPLMTAANATGKIKRYQIIVGGTLIMTTPISYVFLKMGYDAYSVFIVHLVVESITLYLRILFLHKMISLSVKEYIKNVIIRILNVFIISMILPYIAYILIEQYLYQLIFVILISFVSVSTVVYMIGLDKIEREFISNIIRTKILKRVNDRFKQ